LSTEGRLATSWMESTSWMEYWKRLRWENMGENKNASLGRGQQWHVLAPFIDWWRPAGTAGIAI
jgi:hypothetical protein